MTYEVRRAGSSLAAAARIGADRRGRGGRASMRTSRSRTPTWRCSPGLSVRACSARSGRAAQLTAGRIESADLSWRGPLDATAAVESSRDGVRRRRWRCARRRLAAARSMARRAGTSMRTSTGAAARVHAVIDRAPPAAVSSSARRAPTGTPRRAAAAALHRASRRQRAGGARLAPRAPAARRLGAGDRDIDLRGETLLDVGVTLPPRGAPPRRAAARALRGAARWR